MREIVIHSAEGVLHALEPLINGDSCAINAVVDLGEELFQGRDALIDLLIPLPQSFDFLEGRRDHAAYVAEGHPVPRELQREGEVRITENRCVSHRVDQLQACEPSQSRHAGGIRNRCGGGIVILGLGPGGLVDNLLEVLRPIEIGEHVPQILVAQASKQLILVEPELPPPLEGGDGIARGAARHLPLPDLSAMPREKLRCGFPEIGPVRNVRTPNEVLDLLGGASVAHMPHDLVMRQAPLREELLRFPLLSLLLGRKLLLFGSFGEVLVVAAEHALQA
mmetsp:Transcript_94773/g.272824  ORF Transcript_94773/g.272824 Transcript_94773/m.272824 type:complete len:279 (+) Transcript_94773:643-1479(+)